MKRWLSGMLLMGVGLALAACQSVVPHSDRPTVAIDRSMVYSYHLGSDAHAQPYLLIVLNDAGVSRLNDTAREGQPYDIVLDGRKYAQTAQVSGGFLVLNPASPTWTEQGLANLLK